MRKLVIATGNVGKAQEFVGIFSQYDVEILTLKDFPEIGEIEETGTTFAENAALKAQTVAKILNTTVLADDSGLIVDALGGAPGIYSARYAGDHNDAKNNEKLLNELKDVPDEKRTARFHCTLAIATPHGEVDYFEGDCEGQIAQELSGENGFGYDPLFLLPDRGITMANLKPEEKNQISHRANAIKALGKNIEKVLEKIDKK
ncbi:XTP/dITP diphosphatase [Listeria fleischmannii]|uniref:dITP/XTP pyrophosphatase n=1 Tax=Listeria fleischmannii FSL S10-1203 TaxID=1265822 RepID=W7DMJ2_9LIST|nr:XTP/dITP diphosphatase [Listeria fleischmannii]EUJ53541.1 nucleoside-triphosphatase [Listeria fleischmannii FSL S10-1203]